MKKPRSNKSRDTIPLILMKTNPPSQNQYFCLSFRKQKIARVREINQGSGPRYESSLDNRVWITIMSIFITSNVKGFSWMN